MKSFFKVVIELLRIFDNRTKKKYFHQVILNTFVALLEPVLIILVGIIFFLIFNNQSDYLDVNNKYIKIIQKHFDINIIFHNEYYIIIFIVLVYLGINAFNILIRLRKFHLAFISKSFLSNIIFSSYLHKEWEFHTSVSKSQITKEIKNDTSRVIDGIFIGSVDLFENTFKFFLIFLTLLIVNYKISLILLVSIAILFFSIIFLLNKKNLSLGQKETDLDGANFKRIMNSFVGIKNIIIRNNQKFFVKYFREKNESLLKLQMIKKIYLTLPAELFKIINFTIMLIFILFLKIKNENLFFNYTFILGVFFYGLIKMSGILSIIYKNISNYYISLKSFNRLKKHLIFDSGYKIQNKNFQNFAYSENSFKNLLLKNIHFSYSNNYSEVNNITLEINRNQIIGLTGKTGSGKSTVVDIILQLLNYKEGEIIFNDKKINKKDRNLQALISYVSQESFFIEGSLIDNITFGYKADNINLKKIENLIDIVELKNFTKGVKDNLNFIISENGNNLSSGEKQRVALARMLYDDKDLIILDEATNALDFETEKKILNNIIKMGKSILIISHSKKILNLCDKVYVLEDGSIKNINFKEYFNEKT